MTLIITKPPTKKTDDLMPPLDYAQNNINQHQRREDEPEQLQPQSAQTPERQHTHHNHSHSHGHHNHHHHLHRGHQPQHHSVQQHNHHSHHQRHNQQVEHHQHQYQHQPHNQHSQLQQHQKHQHLQQQPQQHQHQHGFSKDQSTPKNQSKPCPRHAPHSPITPHVKHFRHHKSFSSLIGLNKSFSSLGSTSTSTSASTTSGSTSTSTSLFVPKSKARRNSSYHSCDDLDAAASSTISSVEQKVVASLKNLCACTGATLRNLSKRTKDLHAKSYFRTKPTWRFWGEEHEKNAIFTVYLKKVRYHIPTPTANHDSDDEISHLEWETVRVRYVKAATLARLVEALATDDGELESTFINVFLSTYRTFSTPKEVLGLLIRRYDTLHEKHVQEIKEHQLTADIDYDPNASIHEQHKKTLVSALHVWLDGFPEDWNEENLRLILAFASKRLPRSELHIKVSHRLERILRQQIYGDNNVPPRLNAAGCAVGSSAGGGVNVGLGYSVISQQYSPELAEQFAGLCLAPAFRGHTHFLQAFRFPHVPVRHFAEQLTRMDSELFKRLIPHQCLGATWARRDKSGSETVVATINQFNAVLFRVISSILIEPRLKPQERALNIATWIDIAQELRLLKNFSSLKAIISGLQSNPIYRLSKIWAVLSKDKMEIFSELARIFSEDNNAWAQREVLMREGTAKFADTVGEHDRHLQKIIQNQSTQTSHGTIPYLGTFLTDLTMIHAAIPDTVGEDSLINFDKKRKEFEVLAQIKLLQGAANTYNLREDANFDRWFASMLVLDEREAHTLSCQLETPPPAPRKSGNASTNASLITSATNTSSNSMGHRKTDSIASNSSSGAGSQFYCEINNSSFSSHYSSRHNSPERDTQMPNASLMSASSSVSNLSLDSSNSGGQKSLSNNSKMTHSHSANGVAHQRGGALNTSNSSTNGTPLINAQLVQSAGAKTNAPDFYIIRVTYETENVELDGIVLYKSIMLGNNERTPQVIRNAMMKLGLEADPERYTLAQVLPDKELVMPKNANVYYAVNTNYNLNFILRPKKDVGGNN